MKKLVLNMFIGSMFVMFASAAMAQSDVNKGLKQMLQQESDELRDLVSSFSNKMESVKAPYMVKISELQEVISQKDVLIGDLNKSVDTARRETADKLQIIKNMTETLERLNNNLGNTKHELVARGKELKSLRGEKVTLNNKINELESTIKRYADKEEAQKKSFMKKEKELVDKFNSEIETLTIKRNQLIKELDRVIKDSDLKSSEIMKNNNLIGDLEITIAKKANIITSLENEVSQQEEKISKQLKDIKELEVVKSALNKEIFGLKSDNADLLASLKIKESRYSAEEKKNNKLNMELKAKEAKIAALDNVIIKLKAEKEELVTYFKKELSARKKQIKTLMEQVQR